MKRRVEPEILDTLATDDPEAIRSRRDLRVINFIMGNRRWIMAQIRQRRDLAASGIVELGAGRGDLLVKLAQFGPATGIDLTPRPTTLSSDIRWIEGDVLNQVGRVSGGVLVANLFLHHFEPPALRRLGELAQAFKMLIFCEPHRHEHALWKADRLNPLVGKTTRHDMPVSIRAGFEPGELAELMGLTGGKWNVSERTTWRGGQRVLVSCA